MDARTAEALQAYIELAVKRAIDEYRHGQRANAERAQQLQIETRLKQQAYQKYFINATSPTVAEFERLWANGLRDDVLREHAALEQMKERWRQTHGL